MLAPVVSTLVLVKIMAMPGWSQADPTWPPTA
jgi:hypothetical protein